MTAPSSEPLDVYTMTTARILFCFISHMNSSAPVPIENLGVSRLNAEPFSEFFVHTASGMSFCSSTDGKGRTDYSNCHTAHALVFLQLKLGQSWGSMPPFLNMTGIQPQITALASVTRASRAEVRRRSASSTVVEVVGIKPMPRLHQRSCRRWRWSVATTAHMIRICASGRTKNLQCQRHKVSRSVFCYNTWASSQEFCHGRETPDRELQKVCKCEKKTKTKTTCWAPHTQNDAPQRH